jgi:hypothetical protein
MYGTRFSPVDNFYRTFSKHRTFIKLGGRGKIKYKLGRRGSHSKNWYQPSKLSGAKSTEPTPPRPPQT